MKMSLGLGLAIVALAFGPVAFAQNGPINCSIQAYDGHYLTAVGGGGRTTDVLHSNASQVKAWEVFVLEDLGLGTPNITYGIRTKTGNYLTAVGGGGKIQDVMHSNATQALGWEQFQVVSLGNGYYA